MSLLAALGIFAVFEYANKPQTVDLAQLILTATSSEAQSISMASGDSDQDGLKDWEEALWHSDPHKADTDGDGTPDGEEVKEGRDPAKAGPNDKLTSYQSLTQASSTNQTGAFTQTFLNEYASLAQSGNLTDANKQKLLNDLLAETKGTVKTGKLYAAADLKIGTDESAAAVRAYGNAMGTIIVNDSPKKIAGQKFPAELVYMKDAVTTKNTATIAKIQGIVAQYDKMISDMLAVTVPKSAVDSHLAVLNALAGIRATIYTFTESLTDPLAAFQGISTYQTNQKALSAAFTGIDTYFKAKNITFSSTDPGYVYVNIVK